MSTPKVEYRMLGKSGLRVSVPIVSPMQTVLVLLLSTLTKCVIRTVRRHEFRFTEMECAYAPLRHAVRS